MSLWSLCENGDLEGVKVALGRGELDEVNCMEKAAFVVAALRSKKNEAVITLMKHLGFDHAQHTNSFGSFIEGMENRSILQSLHSRCLPRHTVGMKSGLLTEEGPGLLGKWEIMHAIDNFARLGIFFTSLECIDTTFHLFTVSKLMMRGNYDKVFFKAEAKFAALQLEEAHLKEKEIKKGQLKEIEAIEERQLKEKEATEKRQLRRAKKKRNKEKKLEAFKNTAGAAAVESEMDEASGEKVKVKASLRSKISELEMEEERGKLAVASVVEEEKKSSLARESRLMIVQEEKDQLEVELGAIEAAMASLMERKRNIVKRQEEAEKKAEELEEMRKDSEKSTAAKIKNWTDKIENVQEELNSVHQELQWVEGRGDVNSDLKKFMERQIDELREELECPVCLEVTTKAPIYKIIQIKVEQDGCFVFLLN